MIYNGGLKPILMDDNFRSGVMKKILIVNNNLDMGGIQKSLVNLLKEVYKEYDITLMLFSKSGALLDEVPEGVNIITPCKAYSILGLSKEELKKHPLLFLLKALHITYTKIFSRRSAMKLLGIFQKEIRGYNTVISYSHLPHHKYFGNGCGDFVLDKTIAEKKICLIHCDYLNSGYMTEQNNAEYHEFDKIACCSNSVKMRFIQGSSVDSSKVYTLRNFFDFDVRELAYDSPIYYDNDYINIVIVARLSSEKGIDRAIEALHNSERSNLRYYIIGDGPQKSALMDLASKYDVDKQVFFAGEQKNPYRYMLNADYLLVPSRHEAAPMVFDEAKLLGIKIVATRTTSADEMIGQEGGIVCENSTVGITDALQKLKKQADYDNNTTSNRTQVMQFAHVVEG